MIEGQQYSEKEIIEALEWNVKLTLMENNQNPLIKNFEMIRLQPNQEQKIKDLLDLLTEVYKRTINQP